MTRRARGLLLAPTLVQALLLVTVAARPPVPPPALPIVTGDSLLNHAERVALRVLAADQEGSVHRAAPFYTRPWLRDSYAWGMVPDDAGTLSTYARGELRYWLRHQQPFGGWLSFQYSGWYDETAIMIAAVLDAYRLTGDRGMVRCAQPAGTGPPIGPTRWRGPAIRPSLRGCGIGPHRPWRRWSGWPGAGQRRTGTNAPQTALHATSTACSGASLRPHTATRVPYPPSGTIVPGRRDVTTLRSTATPCCWPRAWPARGGGPAC